MAKLGISKDLQAKAGIPIPAPKKLEKIEPFYPNGYMFPMVQLVNVIFDAEKVIKRNGVEETTPALMFVYTTSDGKKYTAIEYPVDETDAKEEEKIDNLNQRVKHIFEEVIGLSYFKEEDFQGDNFNEFFENCAKAFNKVVVLKGEKNVTLYSTTPCYFKLTYYKDRLQLPLYPNFIQKAFNGKNQVPCELLINPTYDKLEPQAKATKPDTYSGGTNNDFGAGEAFPSFPNVDLP